VRFLVLVLLLSLVACVSDPTSGNNSNDITICVISLCNQNHLAGEGDGNAQTSEAEADIEASVPVLGE